MRPAATAPLRRHQLAHLSAAGWQEILALPWDADASACLAHWAAHALPLVVTCQPAPHVQELAQVALATAVVAPAVQAPAMQAPAMQAPAMQAPVVQAAAVQAPAARAPVALAPAAQAPVALGLAAPLAWQRRRLVLRVGPAQIEGFAEFPTLAEVMPHLLRDTWPALRTLHDALQQLGVHTRVYGSAGWQQLTGLRYMHERSDLDLWLAVDDAAQADQVVGLLQACRAPVRIDGELVFAHGGAVAWREWAAWRTGRCRSLLVKRLHGAALEQPGDDLPASWSHAA